MESNYSNNFSASSVCVFVKCFFIVVLHCYTHGSFSRLITEHGHSTYIQITTTMTATTTTTLCRRHTLINTRHFSFICSLVHVSGFFFAGCCVRNAIVYVEPLLFTSNCHIWYVNTRIITTHLIYINRKMHLTLIRSIE